MENESHSRGSKAMIWRVARQVHFGENEKRKIIKINGACQDPRGLRGRLRPVGLCFMCNEVAPEAPGLQNSASGLAGGPTPAQDRHSSEMQKLKHENIENG